ncbi:MAG: DUF1127 domain-containing protein [Xanthobacteraceae bacterium]|nr:DUF1127 domain-containing protein [Xanthobacteraceae bacterium]
MTMISNIPHSAAAVPTGRRVAAALGNFINNWLTAWIAHQERQAARKMLFGFNDRQLRDIGISRSQIDYVVDHSGKRD